MNMTDSNSGAERAPITAVLRRRWRILTACIALGMGIAAVVNFTTTPSYRSTVEVLVNPTGTTGDPASAYQGSQLAVGLATSYAHLITSTEVASSVADELGTPASVKSIQARVQASPITGTGLINISASDHSGSSAASLASAVVVQFNAYLARLSSAATGPVASLLIADPPTVPKSPAEPQPWRNGTIGFVLGLLVGTALAVWRERRPQAQAAEDSAKAAGYPKLVRLPDPAAAANGSVDTDGVTLRRRSLARYDQRL
jgi:capsular polysaccharide biosynthesis protein